MIVWTLKDAEPLPLAAGQRALRSGLLAQELGRRGHQVVWWTSTFSHHSKSFLFEGDRRLELFPNVTLLALNAGRYQRNVSLARLKHHRRLAERFVQMASSEARPDLIIASLPIIDLPYQASLFAEALNIPIIVDVRDPWPDVFADKAPRFLRPLVRWLTMGEHRRAAHSLRQSRSITAVSGGFLRWALNLAGRAQTSQDKVFYLGHSGFAAEAGGGKQASLIHDRIQGKKVFTFVGSFGHSYELDLVAQAAAHFRTSRPEVVFVLIGDGHQRLDIERRYAGLSNLVLTGWLDTSEIAKILAESYVGLVPCRSLPDTVPNKPFEYLAAGLPLISSLEGEMAEIIETDGLGLSYPAGNVSKFIEAVDQSCNDTTTVAQWSANATRAFALRFSAQGIYPAFADHLELVQRLANEPNVGGPRNA